MQTITTLPSDYSLLSVLDLSKKWIFLFLNIFGTVIFFVVGWLLYSLVEFLRPIGLDGYRLNDVMGLGPTGGIVLTIPAVGLFGVLAAFVLTPVVHELVHGLGYWLYTRRRPAFGFKLVFAYCASPVGVYVTRNQLIATALAPFVVMTLVGLGAVVIVPASLVPILLLIVVMNIAGAVGDLASAVWLLFHAPEILGQDTGSKLIVYGKDQR